MFPEGVFWIDLFEFLPDATSLIDLTEMTSECAGDKIDSDLHLLT
jgi:hypothetical protein